MHSFVVLLSMENEEIFMGRLTAVEDGQYLSSRLRSQLYHYLGHKEELKNRFDLNG